MKRNEEEKMKYLSSIAAKHLKKKTKIEEVIMRRNHACQHSVEKRKYLVAHQKMAK